MKEKYTDVEVKTVDFRQKSLFAVVMGSISDREIIVKPENVEVETFEHDKGFDDGGFGDISF